MTVSSTTNRNDYVGDGSADTYAYSFKIFAASDLKVTIANDSAVEFPTLTLDTDYTVTDVGETSGGNIVLVNSGQSWLDGDGDLLTDYTLTIRRVRPITQLTDIRNQGAFLPETHEDEFDKNIMIDQQQQDELDRSVKLAETLDPATFDATIPSDIAESANAGATIIVNPTSDGFDVGPTADTINGASASAAAAAASATAAAGSATSAAASATTAQNAVNAVIYRDVQYYTFADSPITLVAADAGKLLSVDTSGGNVVINLPSIAAMSQPGAIAIKKSDGGANSITVNRDGTDVIDGNTSATISGEDFGIIFVPDTDPSPDEWTTQELGASIAATADETSVAEVGGVTTIGIADNPVIPGTEGMQVPAGTTAQRPGSPVNGDFRYNSSTGEFEGYQNSAWGSIGGGGGGSGINYVSNSNAEADTTGWGTYADAAGEDPVDGTGGSATTTLTRTTSTPLRGTGSFLITKDAANRQGEGGSYDFTVDEADKEKELSIAFDFDASSAFVTGESSDLRIWIYDRDNSVLIEPRDTQILSPSGSFRTTFTTSDADDYRLIFHVATTNASAWTFKFDNVSVGPQELIVGANIGPWIDYTPTFSNLGTVTLKYARYRQVGESYELDIAGTTGTTVAAVAKVSLPNSANVDVPSHNYKVGDYQVQQAGSGIGLAMITDSADLNALFFGLTLHDSNPTGALIPSNGTGVALNSVPFAIQASVKIAGLSTNTVLSNSRTFLISHYMVNGTRVTGSAPTELGEYRSFLRNANLFTFTETNGDPSAAPSVADGIALYDGNVFTSADTNNEPTRYDIFVGKNKVVKPLWYRNSGRTGIVDVTKFSVSSSIDRGFNFAYDPTTGVVSVFAHREQSGSIDHSSGSGDGYATVTDMFFDILVSDNALAVAVEPNDVSMRASGNPASATAGNPIIFPTVDFDTNGAYNNSTGIYTVPQKGKYFVSGYSNGDTAVTLQLYKNGSSDLNIGRTEAGVGVGTFNGFVDCEAGNTLSVRPSGTHNAGSGSHLSIFRI